MRINLSVPYSDKDLAKELGAKWDCIEKTWYIDRPKQHSNELMQADRLRFGRWLRDAPAHKLVDFTPTKWCPAFPKSQSRTSSKSR